MHKNALRTFSGVILLEDIDTQLNEKLGLPKVLLLLLREVFYDKNQ